MKLTLELIAIDEHFPPKGKVLFCSADMKTWNFKYVIGYSSKGEFEIEHPNSDVWPEYLNESKHETTYKYWARLPEVE